MSLKNREVNAVVIIVGIDSSRKCVNQCFPSRVDSNQIDPDDLWRAESELSITQGQRLLQDAFKDTKDNNVYECHSRGEIKIALPPTLPNSKNDNIIIRTDHISIFLVRFFRVMSHNRTFDLLELNTVLSFVIARLIRSIVVRRDREGR